MGQMFFFQRDSYHDCTLLQYSSVARRSNQLGASPPHPLRCTILKLQFELFPDSWYDLY